ncbi:hypothetical protein BS47DRAFT_1397728 [Hydnum rufescens UP504]|uniref:Uncharacterized protein n=1 Tax=Hydnum rufescens UP504 TaxID=1448309 RepID=A0A9P6AMF8_9AGAM|nr:hypothetical protein BS47DRAFT_1397728 [Hydnum rufescens UP504]
MPPVLSGDTVSLKLHVNAHFPIYPMSTLMRETDPERSDSLPVLENLKVPYISLPTSIEQLPTRASVVLEIEKAVARHPIASQEAFDPPLEHGPSPYDRSRLLIDPPTLLGRGMQLSWAIFQIFLHIFAETVAKIFDKMPPHMDHLPHFLASSQGEQVQRIP